MPRVPVNTEHLIDRIETLESRIAELEEGHGRHRDRIRDIRKGVRTALAMIAFVAVVFGIPIATMEWDGREVSISRDTANTELILIGGLLAASLFMGEKPTDLIKSILTKK
jgi:hypothetical protein